MGPWNLRYFRRFVQDDRGYAIVLTLVMMPLLLGFCLLVIDLSRADNLHTDLQNGVDAIALVGARELDGASNSIPRAEEAMKNLIKNQARFSDGGPIIVDYASDVRWKFLKKLPASPDQDMNQGTFVDMSDIAQASLDARFVWVYLQTPRQMTSIFPLPVGMQSDTMQINAQAVATYDVSACNVTPIFICNPYEGSATTLRQAFDGGDLYGRQFDMTLSGNTSAFPGNFGWLQFDGSGGNALQDALATSQPGQCYNTSNLEVKTGGTIGPAQSGLNVRFDIYSSDLQSKKSNAAYRPDGNVRKGASDPSSCSSYTPEPSGSSMAMGLPFGPIDPAKPLGGGAIRKSISDYNPTDPTDPFTDTDYALIWHYFYVNHPEVVCPLGVTDEATCKSNGPGLPLWNPATDDGVDDPAKLGPRSYPGYPDASAVPADKKLPSAFDIYQWEIDNSKVADAAPNTETGTPQCYSNLVDLPKVGRRTIFAAVVNCNAITADLGFSGSSQPIPQGYVEAFVSFFLTRPMITDGSYKTVTGEITGVTGSAYSGELDTFLRKESYLVR